jgi:hypothetical protein
MVFGEFVAHMRARPSKSQDEVTEREFSSRLVEQFARLTVCLAAVLNRPTADEEVMRRVRQCALDTASGRTMDVVRLLARVGRDGTEVPALAVWTGETDDKVRALLRFLRRIRVVERFERKLVGLATKSHWRLHPHMAELYRKVVDDGG